MKYIFTLLIVFTMKLALACTPGVVGSGPLWDTDCTQVIREQERLIQQQQYNNYNSGGRVYVKKPDAWGAVVMNHDIAKVATSGGEASEEEAIKAAQSKCGSNCKVVFTYKNGYLAVVEGKVRGEGYYKGYFRRGETEREAKRKTFKECEAEADGCKLIGTDKSFF